MPIPNAEHASIPAEKLTEYLLNLSHPVGGAKVRWFLSLGYDPSHPASLSDDLLGFVRRSDTFSSEESPFGVKYIVTGRMVAPSGRSLNVVTVWTVESGESHLDAMSVIPYFVHSVRGTPD